MRGSPHWRTIHRQLSQDIFDWAGQLREVDIYKSDTPFCHFAYIEKGQCPNAGSGGEGYLVSLEKAKLVERLAHDYCEINVLHPSVWEADWHSESLEQLAINAGYQLSWQGIEKSLNQRIEWGDGNLTALQMIFSEVISETGGIE
ncbi:putative adenosine monophosphate-protein transferase Fic [Shigella flexneri]